MKKFCFDQEGAACLPKSITAFKVTGLTWLYSHTGEESRIETWIKGRLSFLLHKLKIFFFNFDKIHLAKILPS